MLKKYIRALFQLESENASFSAFANPLIIAHGSGVVPMTIQPINAPRHFGVGRLPDLPLGSARNLGV